MVDSSSGEAESDSYNQPHIEEWERHRVVSYRRPGCGIAAVVSVVALFALAERFELVSIPDTWWMDVVKTVLGIVMGGLSIVILGAKTVLDTTRPKYPAADKPPKPPSRKDGSDGETATTVDRSDESV